MLDDACDYRIPVLESYRLDAIPCKQVSNPEASSAHAPAYIFLTLSLLERSGDKALLHFRFRGLCLLIRCVETLLCMVEFLFELYIVIFKKSIIGNVGKLFLGCCFYKIWTHQ